jgi:conjugal transfer pilus assembly protein TrbC
VEIFMLTLFRLLLPILIALVGAALAILPAHAEQPVRMPSQADLDAQRGAMPRIPDAPAGQRMPGLGDVAEQYARVRQGPGAGTNGEQQDRTAGGLMVFVSLGMPLASLKTLIVDAERSKALLVLRGVVDGSLRKTTDRISSLMGDHKVAWNIDPALFKRFTVGAVPTTVLIDPRRPVLVECGDGARCQGSAFAKVTGDVTIEHALRTIAAEDPEFGTPAQAYLARLATAAARPQ